MSRQRSDEQPARIHLGVSGILVRDGRVLLGKRASTESYPGMFCTPGGGVNHQEKLEDALKREWMEETHLTVTRTSIGHGFVSVQEKFNIQAGRHTIILFYAVEVEGNAEPTITDEFSEYVWFPMRMLGKENFEITPPSLAALKDFYNHYYGQPIFTTT